MDSARSEHRNAVAVVGAGFSGLASSYFLARAGFAVEIHEASRRVGGLIDSVETNFARVETAANGLLASPRVEALFEAAGVRMLEAGREGRARYIYRDGRPRRWPLSFGESIALVARLPSIRRQEPKAGESVEGWGIRVLGPAAYRYGLAPALQGIYAGNPAEMSATLIFGRFFGGSRGGLSARKSKKRVKRGTVAPPGGMRALLEGLRRWLEREGVSIQYGSKPKLSDLRKPVVIATSLPAAREILAADFPEAAGAFRDVRMLPLACVHLAYRRESPRLSGFGCLFPRGEGVRSLGVLFEESIFGERSADHLERWILGGAGDAEIASQSEGALLEIVRADRKKLLGADVDPIGMAFTRWPAAIPHYDFRLEAALRSSEVRDLPKRGIHLVGNYAGRLGLSGILEEAEKLPHRIRNGEAE